MMTKPCISPRQLCFWVFVALFAYPQLSRSFISPSQTPWSAQPSQIIWDLASSLGLMLGIAVAAAILATLESRHFSYGPKGGAAS